MQAYLVKRLLLGLVVLWGISVLVFAIVRVLPGDVVTALTAESGGADPAEAARVRHALGLDAPAHEQYLRWAGGLLRGDLGESLWSGQPVLDSLRSALPATLQLTVMAMIVALVIAIPMGIISAIRQNTLWDYGARTFAVLGVSIPEFLTGSLLLAWLVTQVGWAPPVSYVPFWSDPVRNLSQYVLPALVLGYRFAATTMRMTRSALLEVLREDYIRTAWAKGLQQRMVVVRHALRNALIPIVTIVGMQVGYLLAGSVVVETVFNLPGLGRLLVKSILVRDYPQIQASILLVGGVMVLLNLLVDVLYAVLDPRVRAG